MSIKTVLISQPEPTNGNSPYSKLVRKHKIKVDYRPFIHVEGLTAKEVRAQKVDFSKFQNIVLTSRNAVDHFFRIAEEMRFKVPDQTKYFCQSEAVAYYLQKYVVYRKRKIYVGNNSFKDLEATFLKFHREKFLVPSSGSLNPDIVNTLDSFEISWERAQLFKTVITYIYFTLSVDYVFLQIVSYSFRLTKIFCLIRNFKSHFFSYSKKVVYSISARKNNILKF